MPIYFMGVGISLTKPLAKKISQVHFCLSLFLLRMEISAFTFKTATDALDSATGKVTTKRGRQEGDGNNLS